MSIYSIILYMILLILLQLNIMNFMDNNIDLWLNDKLSNTEILIVLDNEEKDLNSTQDYNFFYKLSIIDLYRGQVFFYEDEKKESISYLETSIENANRAKQIKETSESFRVLSEAGSYLMLQKGVPYIIKNSKAVNENALKALTLDKDNNRASIIVANGLINAPKLFGGNIKEGLNMLLNLDMSQSPKEVKFNRAFTLSKGYKQDKKIDKAIKYCNEALKIYPKNKEALELLFTLKG